VKKQKKQEECSDKKSKNERRDTRSNKLQPGKAPERTKKHNWAETKKESRIKPARYTSEGRPTPRYDPNNQ